MTDIVCCPLAANASPLLRMATPLVIANPPELIVTALPKVPVLEALNVVTPDSAPALAMPPPFTLRPPEVILTPVPKYDAPVTDTPPALTVTVLLNKLVALPATARPEAVMVKPDAMVILPEAVTRPLPVDTSWTLRLVAPADNTRFASVDAVIVGVVPPSLMTPVPDGTMDTSVLVPLVRVKTPPDVMDTAPEPVRVVKPDTAPTVVMP